MAPDKTIAERPLSGRKKDKTRITYLACANADGSERFPLMVIGKAERPFKKLYGHQLGFDYYSHGKAWMTAMLFFDWLKQFNSYIAKKTGRKVILLLDTCSAHEKPDTTPS